jgi:hypothetical protein
MKTSCISKLVEYSLIVVILIVSATIPVSVFAAGTAVVSVSPATQIVSAGSQFTVNITMQPNNAVAGVQFNLYFNPAFITANSVSEGNLFKQNGASTIIASGTINNDVGIVRCVAGAITSPRQTFSTAGTFASITFTAGTTKGSSSITLTNVIVGDINEQALIISLIDGKASVDHAPVLAAIGSAGSYPSLHFQVSDGNLTASENITITVNNVDRSPVLAATGNKTVNESMVLSFNIMASDPDGDALTYTASSLPPGATFNPYSIFHVDTDP